MTYKSLKKCRGCGSKKLYKYLNLGSQPLANSFLKKNQIKKEKKYPLEVVLCEKCKLSQLSIVVSPKKIFHDYDYLSSSSKALQDHYKKLVRNISISFKINKHDNVLDIGCNDGVLLKNYNSKVNIIGVEPSNVYRFIKDRRITIYNNFFDKNLAQKIKTKHNVMKIITMTNVLAHIHDLNSLIKNIKYILADDGFFIIEVPYIYDMIKNNTFDVIYHEHLSYFSLTSLNFIFKINNLKIIDVKKINFGASGPCIRIVVANKQYSRTKKSVAKLLKFEHKIGLNKKKIYINFAKRINVTLAKIQKKINYYKNKNISLACYTAPAKGNTLLNALDLSKSNIQYVSENNKKKIGKYTPGTHLKVVTDNFLKKKNITHALLLSWNYKKFFIKNSKFIKQGGKFIFPFH